MKRSLAILTATALTAGLFTTAPTVARAATCDDPAHPVEVNMTVPQDVAVGTTKTKTMKLEVYTYEGCLVSGATASVYAPRSTKKVTLRKVETRNGFAHWKGVLTIKPSSLRNSDAGVWPTTFQVTGENSQKFQVNNRVQRASRLTFNAGPEPVRRHQITYSGKLERASWNSYRYYGYQNRVIDISRLYDDAEEAEIVGRPTTRSNGGFRLTQTFPGAGDYSADVVPSTTTSGSHSRVDHVSAP